MGILGRMCWSDKCAWFFSVNVATAKGNKKMTPHPFLQFLSGASILVALGLCCTVFISVVIDGRNVWVLSDQSWNACMHVIGCLVGMKSQSVLPWQSAAVSALLGATGWPVRLFLQCCMYICRSIGIFCLIVTPQCSWQKAILETVSLGHEDTHCSFPLKGSMHIACLVHAYWISQLPVTIKWLECTTTCGKLNPCLTDMYW